LASMVRIYDDEWSSECQKYNHSELDTCSCELHSLQWLILSPPKTLTLHPESPYIRPSNHK